MKDLDERLSYSFPMTMFNVAAWGFLHCWEIQTTSQHWVLSESHDNAYILLPEKSSRACWLLPCNDCAWSERRKVLYFLFGNDTFIMIKRSQRENDVPYSLEKAVIQGPVLFPINGNNEKLQCELASVNYRC